VKESRYVIRPGADRDLDEQALYYAIRGSADVGHRFLAAAHETFVMLAGQPEMGWTARVRHPSLRKLRLFRIKGFERSIVLYLPISGGVEVLRVVHGSRNLEALMRGGQDRR